VTKGRWPLFVLFLVNVLNFYDRQVLGAIFEPLRHEFHLSDTELGALTMVFTVVYAIAGLPLGRLADRVRRGRLLALGVAVWSSLTALGALAVNYAALLATRLGVGIGEAVCAPAATSWIGDLYAAGRRTAALARFMMAVPIGGFLSFAVGGPVAQAFGWRAALVLAALPAAILVPALLSLAEPARVARSVDSPSPVALARIPAFWWIAVSGAIVNFLLYSFSFFLPAFLTRVHGLSVARAGVASGVGAGVAGILGALLAGRLGDRMAGNLARSRLSAAALAALTAAPLAFAALRLPAGSAALVVPLLMVAYGLWQTYYGLVYAAIQDIVPAGLRATAMAAYYLAMYLCGAAFGPLVTGGLSDRFAHRAIAAGLAAEAARGAGLHQAMYTIPVLSVALAFVLWAASRSRKNPSLDGSNLIAGSDLRGAAGSNRFS
jgi:MFS family permease